MKKIIVPFDFSEHAGYALDFACQLASLNKGQLLIVHVIDNPVAPGVRFSGEVQSVDQEQKLYLHHLISKVQNELNNLNKGSEYPDVKIASKVVIGNPFESIAEEVSSFNADLIVMGTKGSNGMMELLVGSNAEKVVRFATCPVITISDQFDVNLIQNVVFATNFEDGRSFILKSLSEFQKMLKANIHLLWVHSVHDIADDPQIKEHLQEFANEVGLKDYQIHTVRAVTPEEGIMSFAQDNQMDMIAMTTHGRKGLLHLFLGSVAEAVVNRANRPVWTLSLKSLT